MDTRSSNPCRIVSNRIEWNGMEWNGTEWNGKSRVKEKRPEQLSIEARIKRVLLDNLSKYPWIQMKGT